MRGVGGPLLCIGDLLSDVGADDDRPDRDGDDSSLPSSPTATFAPHPLAPADLHQLFEENYNQLIKSLEGNDHSWTALTLKLCAALKKADKLVNSANSNVGALLQKIAELQTLMDRGDSAVASALAIRSMQLNKEDPAKLMDGMPMLSGGR